MSKVKLHYDTLSQPSRALKLFLLVNRVNHEDVLVNLAKGEHFQSTFEKINPFKKVPVIEHNGFVLTESVAIIRYLCREYDIPDHWYPKDSKLQAKVDEYLEWQHNNTRIFCAGYFQFKMLRPMLSGKPADERMVAFFYKGMQVTLDNLCDIWLKDHKYLCGNVISVADLFGICELDQPRMAGVDVGESRPILKAYMDRVRGDLQPHYGDIIKRVDKFVAKYVDKANVQSKL